MDSIKKLKTIKSKNKKMTDLFPEKKKRDRFNGRTEQEVLEMNLPDHLEPNLDIVIIGINPGLTAAYIGHHYAGPGNHFWKCLYLSGLIPEPMNAYDDFKLIEYGIGFTNIVSRTSRGSSDLTKKEIKEGAEVLSEKIRKCLPKIAVFNGKGIYEIFCGHKNFFIGKQPECFPGTNTAVFVMPSSSARCSQLPRASDKVPFYTALKKLRDHLRGHLPHVSDLELTFPDLELKVEPRKDKVKAEEFANNFESNINLKHDIDFKEINILNKHDIKNINGKSTKKRSKIPRGNKKNYNANSNILTNIPSDNAPSISSVYNQQASTFENACQMHWIFSQGSQFSSNNVQIKKELSEELNADYSYSENSSYFLRTGPIFDNSIKINFCTSQNNEPLIEDIKSESSDCVNSVYFNKTSNSLENQVFSSNFNSQEKRDVEINCKPIDLSSYKFQTRKNKFTTSVDSNNLNTSLKNEFDVNTNE